MLQASVSVQLGDCATACFWTDPWLPWGTICAFAPSLFRAVGRHFRGRTVKDALQHRQWVKDITGALTVPVLCDYVQLWEALENVELNPLELDRFVWCWMTNGELCPQLITPSVVCHRCGRRGRKEDWRAAIPPKVFFWLALHGCLWTAK